MSGKSKQRTKGNLKPSSSGRAAALISKDGAVGFVGFGGLMGNPGGSNLGYVPMASGTSEDVDASVDAEFRMVMRKLMKRDAVTKLKAIQEFTDLCKNSTADAVESALPFWPRIFNKLSLDVDHRVREATQQAMEQLVVRVGRNLAPHLRYIIGPWLYSQFDTYPVVASSGRKSFLAAFSEEKQAEVIMFCRKELFEFLQDNILTQTPSTLSDPKFVAEEEREAKYNRVLSASILALGKLISVTSEKTREEMQELYLSLMREKKFWKYVRHKSPHVRGAVLCTVGIACERFPLMMSSISCLVSPAVLSALDDSDPAVSQHVWDAALSVVKNIADCWKQVNVRKAVLPKFWDVLRNGGSGCASVIFPNLLPFLSKVPAEVVGSGLGFYQDLFNNLQEGLAKEHVQNSPSECSAVVSAFMECMRFCLLPRFDKEGPHDAVQEYLVKEQLLLVMKISLQKQSRKMTQSNLYVLVADLLSYLSMKSGIDSSAMKDSEPEEQKISQQFSQMLNWFWEGLSCLCLEHVKSINQKVDLEYISSLSQCLVALKSPYVRSKKKFKVAFVESSSEHLDNPSLSTGNGLCGKEHNSANVISKWLSGVENLYNGCLLKLVCDVCRLCLDEVTQESSFEHLILLSLLVPHFVSTQLIQTLNNSSEFSSSDHDFCALSKQFVTNTMFHWMKLPYEQVSSGNQDKENLNSVFTDSRSVGHVITIFCSIITPLPVDQQEELVSEAILQNPSVFFLHELVHQGLLSNVIGVVRWLQSAEGKEKLLELSKHLVFVVGEDTSNYTTTLPEDDRVVVWKLLKLCLVTSRSVLMLPTSFVEKVFQYFLRILRQSELDSGQELLLLLDVLKAFLVNCEMNPDDLVPCTLDLLVAVFQIQLLDMPQVSASVSQSLTETWQTGLKVLRHSMSEGDQTPCQTLLLRTAEVIHDKLSEVDTLERVENLVVKAISLLKDASLGDVADDPEQDNLTRRVFSALTRHGKELSFLRNEYYSMGQWLLPPLLEKNLPVMSAVDDSLEDQNTLAALTNHQKMVVFASSLAKEMLLASLQSPNSTCEILTRDGLVGLWLELNWLKHWCACVLGSSDVNEKSGDQISDQVIYKLLLKLRSTSSYLLEHIQKNDWCEGVLFDASVRSRTEGFMWCLVFEGVLTDLQQLGIPCDPALLMAEVQSLASLEEKECQTLNTLISWVDGIYELKIITEQSTGLLSEEKDESGYSRAFAIISSSLQQWFKQTKVCEEALLEYQLTITDILDQLIQWNKIHDSLLLLNSALDDSASMSVLTLNLSLMRILQMAVLHCSEKMSNQHWDFVLCSLAGWFQTCEENRSHLTASFKCVALCCQVCFLFGTVVQFFQKNACKFSKLSVEGQSSDDPHDVASETLERSSHSGDVNEFPPNLYVEWTEFFSETLFSSVLKLFFFHAEECQSASFEATLWSNRISESLGRAVVFTPSALLKKHQFDGPTDASIQEYANESPWIAYLMSHCLPLLKCSAHALQFAAYHLLSKAMAEISLFGVKDVVTEESEDEPVRSPPTPLIELINLTCSRMVEIVSEAKVPFGEYLDMASDTEAQNNSLALILAWKLLVMFFRGLPQENRVEYAKYIRQNKMVDDLLYVLFRLLPLNTARAGTVVADDCEPEIGGFAGQRTIQELARNVSYSLLQWMPAIVRQWWNSLDKRRASIVDKFTTSCITPQLCQREMQVVQNSPFRFDNMQIKTRPSAREVAAVYTVEEMSMELVVKLAPNHPLGVVSVESGRKIGIAAAQWRSWMLQMTTFLTHQNGSIMDGLILWKRNVDKRFEGVEECMICFSVIHGSNYSLPKLSCKTCKKKFHSACLYKWFSTSNNATCPLCRNLF